MQSLYAQYMTGVTADFALNIRKCSPLSGSSSSNSSGTNSTQPAAHVLTEVKQRHPGIYRCVQTSRSHLRATGSAREQKVCLVCVLWGKPACKLPALPSGPWHNAPKQQTDVCGVCAQCIVKPRHVVLRHAVACCAVNSRNAPATRSRRSNRWAVLCWRRCRSSITTPHHRCMRGIHIRGCVFGGDCMAVCVR